MMDSCSVIPISLSVFRTILKNWKLVGDEAMVNDGRKITPLLVLDFSYRESLHSRMVTHGSIVSGCCE